MMGAKTPTQADTNEVLVCILFFILQHTFSLQPFLPTINIQSKSSYRAEGTSDIKNIAMG